MFGIYPFTIFKCIFQFIPSAHGACAADDHQAVVVHHPQHILAISTAAAFCQHINVTSDVTTDVITDNLTGAWGERIQDSAAPRVLLRLLGQLDGQLLSIGKLDVFPSAQLPGHGNDVMVAFRQIEHRHTGFIGQTVPSAGGHIRIRNGVSCIVHNQNRQPVAQIGTQAPAKLPMVERIVGMAQSVPMIDMGIFHRQPAAFQEYHPEGIRYRKEYFNIQTCFAFMVGQVVFSGRYIVRASACEHKQQTDRQFDLKFRQKTLRNLNLGLQVEAHENLAFRFCIDSGRGRRVQRQHAAHRVHYETNGAGRCHFESDLAGCFQLKGGSDPQFDTDSGIGRCLAQIPFLCQLARDGKVGRNRTFDPQFCMLSRFGYVVGQIYGNGKFHRALRADHKIIIARGNIFMLYVEFGASGDFRTALVGHGPHGAVVIGGGNTLIGNAFVSSTVIHYHILAGSRSLDLDGSKDFFHLHLIADDGGCRTINGNVCHLDDQKFIFRIGVDKDIAFLQRSDLLVHIFNNVGGIFFVDSGHGVAACNGFNDPGRLRINGEVRGVVIIQVQDPVFIVVFHGGFQQLLHILGVHRRIIGGAQRGIVVCIHQIGGCHEVFGHGILETQHCFRILRTDLCRCAGQHLHTVLGIQSNHQHGLLHGAVGHISRSVFDDQVGHRITGFIFRGSILSLRFLDLLAQQGAEAVGALDCHIPGVYRSLCLSICCKCLYRKHGKYHSNHKTHCQ